MFGRFRFLNPFPLVDGDLELVPPGEQYLDPLLTMLRDPLTAALEPEASKTSRGQIIEFIGATPLGHQAVGAYGAVVPAYHFWMAWHDRPDHMKIVGGLTLRVGTTADIVRHIGHVGYNVYPPARGHRFAERATRLLFPLARQHGMDELWITCNPDNLPSRRTIEKLGGRYIDTVTLPLDHPLRARGETDKMRFLVRP